MNRNVTSKQQLLKAAKEIIAEEGIEHLSIRDLANRVGIAVGSVYNYFPSKAMLLFSIVEDFWEGILSEEIAPPREDLPFPDLCETIYLQLTKNMASFRAIFMSRLSTMKAADRAHGKAIEERYLRRLAAELERGLRQEQNIPSALWSKTFTPEKYAAWLVAEMIGMLAAGEKDYSFEKEVIRRTLQMQ